MTSDAQAHNVFNKVHSFVRIQIYFGGLNVEQPKGAQVTFDIK